MNSPPQHRIGGNRIVEALTHECPEPEECEETHLSQGQELSMQRWNRTNSIDRRGILDAIDLVAEEDPAGRENWRNLKALGEAFG